MNIKRWVKISITTAVVTAVFATTSMTVLASPALAGELTVSGTNADAKAVLVNGDSATTGRTVLAPSTIVTPDGLTAVVNFGKAGKISLAPNSTYILTNDLGGDLSAGSVTVINAPEAVNIKNSAGEIVKVNAGETADAAASASKRAPRRYAGLTWWEITAIVTAVTVTAVVVAVVVSGDDTPTSPVR